MSRPLFESIDWRQPWLAPWHSYAAPILQASDWRAALNRGATAGPVLNHRGCEVRFVAQEELPSGVAYEAFISDTGCVPTRDNLHDFFNALAWLAFPAVKSRLNALQAAEINRLAAVAAPKRTPIPRGRLRDAATIFDENAIVLVSRDNEVNEALRQHRWQEAFLSKRERFGETWMAALFGHALAEKLVNPYKAITAHALIVPADQSFFELTVTGKQAWIDQQVAERLRGGLTTADFTPLPILGVPGWWEGQDEFFYDDQKVFRPKRIGI